MLSGNAKSRLLLSAFIITVATVVGNTSYENTFEIEIFGYTFSTKLVVRGGLCNPSYWDSAI